MINEHFLPFKPYRDVQTGPRTRHFRRVSVGVPLPTHQRQREIVRSHACAPIGITGSDSRQFMPQNSSIDLRIEIYNKISRTYCFTPKVTLLKSNMDNEYLLVANTHLYSQMDAAHIRLLQVGFSMLYIADVYKKALETLNISKDKLSLIFCGDMNSMPDRGVREFIEKKVIDSGHIDFRSSRFSTVTMIFHIYHMNKHLI